MRYTTSQQSAITSGGNLLVSAGAGSGKTSVLAARVLRILRDGGSLERMLICTFTNAAAAEMRERIVAALTSSGDPYLAKQAELAGVCHICTIHRFCGDVFRESHTELGLADLKQSGEAQIAELKRRSIDNVFEALYAAKRPEFFDLLDKFTDRNDKPLRDIIEKIYSFCSAKPEGLDWLKSVTQPDLVQKQIGECLEELIAEKFELAISLIKNSLTLTEAHEKQHANDTSDLEKAQWLCDLYHENPSEATLALIDVKFSILNMKGADEQLKKAVQELKKSARTAFKDVADLVKSRPLVTDEVRYTADIAAELYLVISAFGEEFSSAKLKAGVMDFDDTLRFCASALENPKIADKYRAQYDHVFIDEYQDTNRLQDKILTSFCDNIFMVGDVKQSIYRFRLADPTIFTQKSSEFTKLPNSKVVYLNDNFRSSCAVTEPINHIMSRLMSQKLGEIDYTDDEKLRSKLDIPGRFELLITTTENVDDEEYVGTIEAEAASIARRILSLERDGEGGVNFSRDDICVIARAATAFPIFEDIFARFGIGVSYKAAKHSRDEQLFISLLNIIDASLDDISLLTVMRSHIGGFSDEEIANVRVASRKTAFFTALREYAGMDSKLGAKCAGFLRKLERFKIHARSMPLSRFLIWLKQETLFSSILIARGGVMAKTAFDEFFSRAVSLSDGQTLSGLIRSLAEPVKTADISLTACGKVRLMTIHASKGLEFPVVIFARTSARFYKRDLQGKKDILLHSKFGLGINIIDGKARTLRLSTTRQIVQNELMREFLSEELRSIYVAMTRAKNVLIISGCTKNADKISKIRPVSAALCPLDWIMCALSDLSCFADWGINGTSDSPKIPHALVPPNVPNSVKENIETLNLLRESSKLKATPFLSYTVGDALSKVGITALLPEYQTEETDFVSGVSGNMQLGTLVHLVLLHAPITTRGKAGVLTVIGQMRDKLLLTETEAEQLKAHSQSIAGFFDSALAARIAKAQKIWREQPFSMAVSSIELGYSVPDEVVVQGIIDVIFEEDGKLILVDYKDSAAENVSERYKMQMKLYSMAVEKIWGKVPTEVYLYYLGNKAEVRL